MRSLVKIFILITLCLLSFPSYAQELKSVASEKSFALTVDNIELGKELGDIVRNSRNLFYKGFKNKPRVTVLRFFLEKDAYSVSVQIINSYFLFESEDDSAMYGQFFGYTKFEDCDVFIVGGIEKASKTLFRFTNIKNRVELTYGGLIDSSWTTYTQKREKFKLLNNIYSYEFYTE